MKIRVLLVITVMSIATVADARSPFGRSSVMRSQARPTAQPRPTGHPVSAGVPLENSEEMTKRYGPSILVRNESIRPDAPHTVTQPN